MSSSDSASTYLVRIPLSDRVGIYGAHQAVYEACGRESRPLWRRSPGYVLALSSVAPIGLESRPYSPAPRVGQETRFDLLAEVSIARKTDGQQRGRRSDPILEARFANPDKPYAELANEIGRTWLCRQGERLGFELLDLDRCDYEVIEFVRMKKPVRIGAVRYAGRLRVTDKEKFTTAMLNGIGHSKAWGCGLLLCFGA
jgi:CRISPR-associated protein Cas6/Cse3/CasE subtype I-E